MAEVKLTRHQIETIKRAAALSGEVTLYRETSMSGASETLRYCRRFAENTRWGRTVATRSGMILSVPIMVLADGSDDPASLDVYRRKCELAEQLFKQYRSS